MSFPNFNKYKNIKMSKNSESLIYFSFLNFDLHTYKSSILNTELFMIFLNIILSILFTER